MTTPKSVAERERRARHAAARRRVCRYCEASKPLSEFVTYSDECLACRSDAKTCPDCGERQPLDAFYVNGRGVDGRMHHCKSCARAAAKSRPREKARARDLARKAQRNARLRARRLADPAWASAQNERARLRHQRIATEGASLRQLADEAGWVCYLCGEGMDAATPLEVDHVVPRALGGLDARPNVAATHRACNRRKSDRHPTELPWVAATAAAVIDRAMAA